MPRTPGSRSQTGADAIIVSNHGGRQLDGAPSSIAALPAIVDAVGNSIEVHLDGGIRSGQDVVKALALGAKGTYIGRAFLYGLGAMGEAGVTRCLQIIANELDLTMAFCGLRNVQDIDSRILLPRKLLAGTFEVPAASAGFRLTAEAVGLNFAARGTFLLPRTEAQLADHGHAVIPGQRRDGRAHVRSRRLPLQGRQPRPLYDKLGSHPGHVRWRGRHLVRRLGAQRRAA